VSAELLPCPFCGSENVDPKGWLSTAASGPACDDCGATAETVKDWNRRAIAAASQAQPAQQGDMGAEVLSVAGRIAAAVAEDEDCDGCDISAGLFGPKFSAVVRELVAARSAPRPVLTDALAEAIGCFEAAEVEGLSQVLAESTDERLKDLVTRRLMHALPAIAALRSRIASAPDAGRLPQGGVTHGE
jgi:hypothetical protein